MKTFTLFGTQIRTTDDDVLCDDDGRPDWGKTILLTLPPANPLIEKASEELADWLVRQREEIRRKVLTPEISK